MTVTGDAVTLYPAAIATPSSTLYVPITVTPALNTTIQGKIVFETATGGEIYTVIGLVDMATGKVTEPQCAQICFVPSWNSDASGRAPSIEPARRRSGGAGARSRGKYAVAGEESVYPP